MAYTSALEGFVLFMASVGGLVLLLTISAGVVYAIVVAKVPMANAVFPLFWIGLITCFALNTVDLATQDTALQRAVIISQGTIFSILIVLLGLLAHNFIGLNLADRQRYIMWVIPVTMLLSVVSLTANMMTKLSSA